MTAAGDELPLIGPSLIAGSVLCWARALGEFNATITFAGNLPGTTQTMPIAVNLALERDPEAAIALSLVMLAVSVAVLVALRALAGLTAATEGSIRLGSAVLDDAATGIFVPAEKRPVGLVFQNYGCSPT